MNFKEPKKPEQIEEIGSLGMCFNEDDFSVIEEGLVDDENLIVYKQYPAVG